MGRYEHKIKCLENQIVVKQEQLFKVEDEIVRIRKDIKNLKELQERLPERHHFTWEQEERNNLLSQLRIFIEERAKIHKRTPVAIAAQIHHQKWLMMSDNFIEEGE